VGARLVDANAWLIPLALLVFGCAERGRMPTGSCRQQGVVDCTVSYHHGSETVLEQFSYELVSLQRERGLKHSTTYLGSDGKAVFDLCEKRGSSVAICKDKGVQGVRTLVFEFHSNSLGFGIVGGLLIEAMGVPERVWTFNNESNVRLGDARDIGGFFAGSFQLQYRGVDSASTTGRTARLTIAPSIIVE
jgi:hypothetical protein